MDDKTRERLARIVTKDLSSLIEEDKAFLRARRTYLNIGQKKKFASVLKPDTK